MKTPPTNRTLETTTQGGGKSVDSDSKSHLFPGAASNNLLRTENDFKLQS